MASLPVYFPQYPPLFSFTPKDILKTTSALLLAQVNIDRNWLILKEFKQAENYFKQVKDKASESKYANFSSNMYRYIND